MSDTVETQPLTDLMLDAAEQRAEHGVAGDENDWLDECRMDVRALVAEVRRLRAFHVEHCEPYAEKTEALREEVRRLRSDEWLRRAAEELAAHAVNPCGHVEHTIAIIRKHRDGA